MFRQETSSRPNLQDTAGTKHHKKLYALLAGIILIAVLAAALLIAQGSGSSIQLSLNYTVGEHMVYDTTSTVTGQQSDLSIVSSSTSYNSTEAIDVLSFDGENYALNETITAIIENQTIPLSVTVNMSKTSYYNNFIAPGGPDVFYNISSNPTLAAYLAKSTVNVGDVWQIPVNTGNASLGLTGEMTLKFIAVQDLTVPAGTFKTFKIGISTSNLTMHYDADYLKSINLSINGNYTLQMTGTTYLEQGTCRLIKADLTQESTLTQENAAHTGAMTITSTIFTEKTLTQDTKP
jgi:hypothetical protein